jgi:hypothetical protein
MRCLVCAAAMNLMKVVQDDAMPVPGFEHHTFMCSACGDVERRLVFRHAGQRHGEPPEHAAPSISPALPVHDERIAAPGIVRRVVAKLRGGH